MKIRLKSNLNLKVNDLDTKSSTLGELVEELSANYGVMYPDCEVLLNGRSYQVLPKGLETRLKDGDEVEVQMFMLGGG